MKRQYVITALTRLKSNQAIHNTLMEQGIDCTAFFDRTGYISLVEEAIAIMLCGRGDDMVFERALCHIQDWLYEEPYQLLYNADDFVNWLFTRYEVEE